MTRKELKTKNLTTVFVLLNNLQKIGNAPETTDSADSTDEKSEEISHRDRRNTEKNSKGYDF